MCTERMGKRGIDLATEITGVHGFSHILVLELGPIERTMHHGDAFMCVPKHIHSNGNSNKILANTEI